MRRLCLCLLISLPALLAGPAHTSNTNVPQNGPAVDYSADSVQVYTADALRVQTESSATLQKTREFTNWLSFASVPDAINLVHGLMADEEMGAVQREAILMRLTKHLRSYPASAAGRAAMLELTTYQSQVMTHDHEDDRLAQPAFNIAASARGALNEWRYAEISMLLAENSALDLWARFDDSDRDYLLTALRAGYGDHEPIASHHQSHPRLAAAGVLGAGDLQGALLIAAEGASSAAMSIVSATISDNSPFLESDANNILTAAADHADPAVAGLARHELSLRQMQQQELAPQNIAALTGQLSDPQAGAGAAMTLAQVLSDQQLSNLISNADPDNHMLQARIKLIQQLRGDLP